MGSGVKMILKPVLACLPLNLPGIDIQRRIALLASLVAEEENLLARLSPLRREFADAQLDRAVLEAASLETSGRAPSITNRKTP
jgi:hypothetical protein